MTVVNDMAEALAASMSWNERVSSSCPANDVSAMATSRAASRPVGMTAGVGQDSRSGGAESARVQEWNASATCDRVRGSSRV
jgi:hypothetical protein